MSETAIRETAAEEEARVLGLAPVDPPLRRAYGDHPDQVYDLWPAEDPDAPMVMLLHGGYWRDAYDRTHLSPLAAHLAGAGFTSVLLEYRRAGGAGGYPGTFDDIALAVDTIPAGRPVVLLGHCSGGHLALWAGARALLPEDSRWHTAAGPAGVLALAPVTDLVAAIKDDLSTGAAVELLGGRELVAARLPFADPFTIVRGKGPTGVPTVVLHGAEDAEVPLSQFRDYAAADPGAELVSLPGTGHYTLIEPGSPACAVVIDLLTRLTAHRPGGSTP